MAALYRYVFEYVEFQVDEQDPNQHVDWKLLPKWQADRVAANEGTMHLGPGSMSDGLYKYHLTSCVAPFIADHGLVWKPTNASRPWAPRCARAGSIAMSGLIISRSAPDGLFASSIDLWRWPLLLLCSGRAWPRGDRTVSRDGVACSARGSSMAAACCLSPRLYRGG